MKISQDQLDNLAVNAGVGIAGRFLGRFLSVFESLVAARVLGPTTFGLYALGLTIFRLIELISPLGLDIGIVKYGTSHLIKGNREALKGAIIWSSIVSFFFSASLGLIMFWSAPWIAANVFKQEELAIVFQVFAPAIPLSGLLAILSATSRLRQKMIYSIAMHDLGQPMLALAILLIFWLSGLNLERVILADQLSYLFSVLLAVYFLKLLFPWVLKKSEHAMLPNKELYSFSFASSASIFLSTLVLWIDRLFAGIYLSPSDVGVYQAALQISVIFALLLGSFSRILLPIFSILHAERNFNQLEEIFRIGTKWSFYLGLPIVLFIFLNPQNIMKIIYGEAYSFAGEVLYVLLIGQLINLVTGAVGPLLLVGGYHRIVLLLSSAMLIVNSFLCVILIPSLGIIGAALSNTISVTLMYTIALILVRIKMKLWPYDFRYLKGFVSIGFAAFCALLIRFSVADPPLVKLALQFFIVVFSFMFSLYVLGLSQEDQVFIAMILKRLGIKKEFVSGRSK